mgnify:CR=1 FL=1
MAHPGSSREISVLYHSTDPIQNLLVRIEVRQLSGSRRERQLLQQVQAPAVQVSLQGQHWYPLLTPR